MRLRCLERRPEGADRGEREAVVLREAKKLEDLVSYCQATCGKKQSYVNIAFTETEGGEELAQILDKALRKEGWRQWDTAPLKPIHREINDTLRGTRKGAGKGR